MRLHTINNKLYEIDLWFTMVINQQMDDSLWWSSVFKKKFGIKGVDKSYANTMINPNCIAYIWDVCIQSELNCFGLIGTGPDTRPEKLEKKSFGCFIICIGCCQSLVYDIITVFALRLYLLLLVHQLAHFIDEQRTSEWSVITNECSTRACVWVYICRCHHLRPFHQWIKPLL